MPTRIPYQNTHEPRGGLTLAQKMMREAAGETFRDGDPVYLDSSGNVRACAVPGALLDSTGHLPIGVANKAASNLAAAATDEKTGDPYYGIPVTIFTSDTISTAPVNHATAAQAVTAATQKNQSYQIRINPAGSPGGFRIALDHQTNPVVKVYDVSGQFPVGSLNGTLEVEWLNAALQGSQ